MPPLPRVTCAGYITASGARIRCDRVIQAGEPGGREFKGCCVTCGALQKKAWEQKWQREDRKLLRDRAKGYGPGTGDPFAGF